MNHFSNKFWLSLLFCLPVPIFLSAQEKTPQTSSYTVSSSAIPTGLYLIKSAVSEQPALQLNGYSHFENKKFSTITDEQSNLASVWQLEVKEGTENGYVLRNLLTSKSIVSFVNTSCDHSGNPIQFFPLKKNQYLLKADGYLCANEKGVKTQPDSIGQGTPWILEKASKWKLRKLSAKTQQKFREVFADGKHSIPLKIDSLLQLSANVSRCQELYQNCYVSKKRPLRVMQFNTWHNGNIVGGLPAIASCIEQVHPDIVLLQEIRSQGFIDGLIDYFKKKGITYYGRSLNISSAILSRYPLETVRNSDELGKDSYAFVKATVSIDNQQLALYSIHLDWTHLPYYNIKGFDGVTYKKIEPWTNVDDILAENKKSRRVKEIQAIINDSREEIEQQHLVILGGDFNEPSHLDWQTDTKNLRDHNNLVVNWDCSVMLNKSGFRDCYRDLYPNAVTHPGFTCNAGNKDVAPKELTWAWGVDDRERIDHNYYYPNPNMKHVDAFIVGPKEDFYDKKIQYEPTQDSIFTPKGIWPSDHKAVVNDYELNVKELLPGLKNKEHKL